jgi:hypothetical protein
MRSSWIFRDAHKEHSRMLDILYLTLGVFGFGVCVAYISICTRV